MHAFDAVAQVYVCFNTDMDTKVWPAWLQAGNEIKTLMYEHTHTQQRLCVAAATRSDPRHSLPITPSSTYQSFSLFIPLPANAHIGVLCRLRAPNMHTHIHTVTRQYLWGFLLAVVPVWAWLLGSVCLVLIWLHKLHQRRGFTLNRIFGLFYWLDLTRRILSDGPRLKRQEGLRLILGVTQCAYVCSFRMSAPKSLHECMWGRTSSRQDSRQLSKNVRIVWRCCFLEYTCSLCWIPLCVCDRDFSKVCLNLSAH